MYSQLNMSVPSLQEAVDRYGTSLTVPDKLASLHPRKQGSPGNAAAVAPAIVLTTISAFEGFVEEFLALAAGHRGMNYAQIARFVTMNNPTVQTFQDKLQQLLGWGKTSSWKPPFQLEVFKPPAVGASWFVPQTITWSQATAQAESWMQVRHCLSHGLTAGWRTEIWPGPLKGTASASDVLRPYAGGKHSLVMHGAISCGRIFRTTAQLLADKAAAHISQPALDWSSVPILSLKKV